MVSSVVSFLIACILLFTGGRHAAIGASQGGAREEELPWEVSAKETSPARRAGTVEASTGLVLARRELAARLGGATKGSSPAKGTGKGAVHPSDAAALLKAAAQWKKDPDTVDKRKLLATWNSKRPCSQWFGVTCDSVAHRVTAIKLTRSMSDASFMLAGPFPAELGSLPELRSLILARNYLGSNQTFPKAWARLGKLSHLDLSDNSAPDRVSEAVPLALCNLTSLTYLNLANVGFYHLPKQFKGLKRLAWLDLSSTQLDGGDVQTLGSLSGLKTLHLKQNGLGLAQVSGLSRLRGLRLLDLSANLPAGFWKGSFPTFLSGLTGLEDLRLASTSDAGGVVPSWVARLQQLTSLDLSNNYLTGSLPTQLGALSKLSRLLLKGNFYLRGRVPQVLLNSPSLTDIDLSGNQLSLAGITFGPHAASRLRRLDLSQNSLKGTIPKGLTSLTRLQSLSLSSTQLSGALPLSILTIPTLTKLDLSGNILTGLGPSSQQIKAGGLMSLDLSGNKFRGSIPKDLSAVKSLTALSLSRNQFTGSIPSWLEALRRLVSLDLGYNQLTGSIPSLLGALAGLVSLDLSHNQLTGSIPPALGASKRRTYLTLSDNQLTGSLPGSIFRADSMLNVANNQLSGNLPAKALDLFAQRFLFFGTNQGSYPLGSMDVSGNFLTGPCYKASLPWVRNASWIGCWAREASQSCEDSTRMFVYELSFLRDNCLQGCKIPSLVALGVPEGQRSKAQCAHFCGADKRNGPCNGHGSCSGKGPKRTPSCTCSKGFVAPASNPGTCVPTPK